MATLPTEFLHFPEASPAGPFGVGGTLTAWYVVHKVTGRARCIGRVGGKKVNYFVRAIAEAHRRNVECRDASVPKPPAGYTADELERDNPYNQWMYED